MAEPARQNDIYDEPDATAASNPKPNLKKLEGGGETTEPKLGHLTEVGDEKPDRDQLSEAENKPAVNHPQTLGRGYTGPGISAGRFSLKGFNRKRVAVGGGLGFIGAIIIAMFFLLLPVLRLESYLSTINERVFGFAANAVTQRTENLFGRYMINHVLTLERCNNKITNNCRADYSKSGYATSLFNAWRDAKVEQELIDKYGLTFETHNNSGINQTRITIRSAKTGEVINLTNGQIAEGKFTGGSREFGNEINKFLKNETRWYDVMQRKSVRKYLVRKHGTKFWCFMACKTKDNVDLKIADSKTRFKYRFVERVVYPFSTKYGFIMDCIISGGSTEPGGACSPEELRKRGIDRNTISDLDIDETVKLFKESPDAKLSQIILQKLLIKIMSEQATRSAISAIPIAGQIYLAATIVDMLDSMDGFIQDNGLSKFAADINSRQYLEYYTVMRSANDEMKEGVLGADEVGAIMGQFEGPQGPEKSKIYQAYSNPQAQNVALFSSKAYAATAQGGQDPPYLCADGKPIPEGELVCNEKKVARTFSIETIRNDGLVSGLVGILNTYHCIGYVPIVNKCIPGIQILVHPLLKSINAISAAILGPGIEAALSLLEKLPGGGDFIAFVKANTDALITAFFGKIFPLPVSLTGPAREKYDGLWGGGEVAASEFGKGGYTEAGEPYGLGGKLLSASEQSTAWSDYNSQEDYNFSHSSIISKLTNLNYRNSLGSRVIAAMPASFAQLENNIASMISSPFGGLSFTGQASADNGILAKSPFGIPRFGYAANDPALTADPGIYTDEYCKTVDQTWEASKTEDPLTGIDQYSTTNPCLLERVTVEAASSIYTGDDSLN